MANSITPIKALDTTFNILGYIPVVSSISGPFRQYFGIAKIVASIALAIFAAIGAATTAPGIVSYFLFAGCLDIIRGGVEKVPVLGNLACIVYDIARVVFLIS